MTKKRYWFSDIVQSLRLTSSPYEVSAKTGSIITSIESVLITRKSDVSSTLLSLDAPPSLLDQFHQAKNEVNSPFSLPTNTIFPETIFPLSLDIRTQSTEANILFNNNEQLSELHQMLSRDGCDRKDFSSTSECATQLIDQGLLSPVDPSSKDNCLFEEPGVYRLQHACLLFKSLSLIHI